MILKKKSIYVLCFSLILIFGLSFLQGDVIHAEDTEETTLRFSFWGTPDEVPPYEEIVERFESKNPNINIDIYNYSWGEYFDRIQTMMAADDEPDVMFLHTIPSWAARGVAEPLDDYLEKTDFPIEYYNQELLSTFEYEGELYGLPRDNDTAALFYNKSLFDEEEMDYPDDTWTWDDLRQAADQLTVKEGGRTLQYGLVLERNRWPIFLHQNEGAIFDDYVNPNESRLHEEEAIEAMNFIKNMIEEGSVPNLAEEIEPNELFLTERVAMIKSNAAQIPSFEGEVDFGIAPLPKGKTRANTLGGAGFVMSSNSDNKEDAWKFMDFLGGSEGQAVFAESGDAVPALVTEETREAFVDNPPGVEEREILIDEMEHGVKQPLHPDWVEIDDFIERTLDDIWTGSRSAEQTMEYISEEVDSMIDEDAEW